MEKGRIKGLNLKKMKLKLRKELLISIALTILVLAVTMGVVGLYYYKSLFPFSNVNIAKQPTGNVKVEFATKIPVKSKIEYGTTDVYVNSTETTGNYEMSHLTTIDGLLPKKDHYFRLVVLDEKGNEYMSNFYFL